MGDRGDLHPLEPLRCSPVVDGMPAERREVPSLLPDGLFRVHSSSVRGHVPGPHSVHANVDHSCCREYPGQAGRTENLQDQLGQRMNCVILGGRGFIGSCIAELFYEMGM